MQLNPASLQLRHSRRSACNRCRIYKIRCQREVLDGEPCERCIKARLPCTTTDDRTSQRLPGASHHRDETGRGGSTGVVAGELYRMSPARPRSPPEELMRRSLFGLHPSQQHHSLAPAPRGRADPLRTMPSDTRSRQLAATSRPTLGPTGDDILMGHDSVGLGGMDFEIPDLAFGSNDLVMFIADHEPPQTELGTRRSGGVEDAAVGWHSQDVFGEGSASIGAEMPTASSQAPQQTYDHTDLLRFTLELVEFQDWLDAAAPLTAEPNPHALQCSASRQHQPVNHVLSQTSRFWNMLKSICVAADAQPGRPRFDGGVASGGRSSSSSTGSGIQAGWSRVLTANAGYLAIGDVDSWSPSSSASHLSKMQDHLLVVHVVTAYVCLVRSCRAVFTGLHQAVELSLTGDLSAVLSLPSLQFGEFQLDNSKVIQVKVLIELASSMLVDIRSALGIGSADVPGISGPTEDREYRMPFLGDPAAVSIRDIVLSQEKTQGGAHGGEPPLEDILNNLRRLLERR